MSTSEANTVDINCDCSESFGRWILGDDLGMMDHVTSINVATGYHGGDPPTIRRAVNGAVERGVNIGAHIAFPDLMGFGRRKMWIDPADLQDMCLYQIGALQAFVTSAGARLTHVKPHGSLYVMASDTPEYADAVAAAVAEVDASLPLLLLTTAMAEHTEKHGVQLVPESFPDLHYTTDGHLIIERIKKAWDPELVASRAVRMATDGTVVAEDGETVLPARAPTLCLHGDAPNGVEIARTTRRRLDEAGVAVKPLPEILAA
jgi:5-oxoprolinase (ATP-hydrolysing) subunit A